MRKHPGNSMNRILAAVLAVIFMIPTPLTAFAEESYIGSGAQEQNINTDDIYAPGLVEDDEGGDTANAGDGSEDFSGDISEDTAEDAYTEPVYELGDEEVSVYTNSQRQTLLAHADPFYSDLKVTIHTIEVGKYDIFAYPVTLSDTENRTAVWGLYISVLDRNGNQEDLYSCGSGVTISGIKFEADDLRLYNLKAKPLFDAVSMTDFIDLVEDESEVRLAYSKATGEYSFYALKYQVYGFYDMQPLPEDIETEQPEYFTDPNTGFTYMIVNGQLVAIMGGEDTEPADDSEETDPVETEPEETVPVETDPSETEPAETHPADADPVETDPSETEPEETVPVETDPSETEPEDTYTVDTHPDDAEPAETEAEDDDRAKGAVDELSEAEDLTKAAQLIREDLIFDDRLEEFGFVMAVDLKSFLSSYDGGEDINDAIADVISDSLAGRSSFARVDFVNISVSPTGAFAKKLLAPVTPAVPAGCTLEEAYAFLPSSMSDSGINVVITDVPSLPNGYVLAIYRIFAENGNTGFYANRAYVLGDPAASDLSEGDSFTFYPADSDGFALVVVPGQGQTMIENEDGIDVSIRGQLPAGAEIKISAADAPSELDALEAYRVEISGTEETLTLEFRSENIDRAIADGESIRVYAKDAESGEFTALESAKVRDGAVSVPVSGSTGLVIAVYRPDASLILQCEGADGQYSVSVECPSDSSIRGAVRLETEELESGTGARMTYITSVLEEYGMDELAVVSARTFDIAAVSTVSGSRLQPAGTLAVTIRTNDIFSSENRIYVFSHEDPVRLIESEISDGAVTFSADRLGVFTVVECLPAMYVFTGNYANLADVLSSAGVTLVSSTYSISADNPAVRLSGRIVKKEDVSDILVIAEDTFEYATLILKGSSRKDEIRISVSHPAEPEYIPEIVPGVKINPYDYIELSGRMPRDAVVDITPVYTEIEGEDVIVSFDIKIYANEAQREKGITWQPAGKKVTVRLKDEAFGDEELNIYHTPDGGDPEYVTTVEADNGTVKFEADSFSIWSVSGTGLIDSIVSAVRNFVYPDTVYENDEIILTGKLPRAAIIEAERVDAQIEGRETLVAYDIKIYSNRIAKALGITWQPTDGDIQVRLKSDALNGISGNVEVYHIEDGSSDEIRLVGTYAPEDSAVTFSASGFSVYVITPETFFRTYRFYTLNEYGDYTEYAFTSDTGTVTFTQTIKNGESPVVPSNPVNPQDPTATFAGWYQGVTSVGESTLVLDSKPYDFSNIPTITTDEEVHLYAKFLVYAYVIFHDQKDQDTGTFPVAYTMRVDLSSGSDDVDINDRSVVYIGDRSKVFYGWSKTKISTPGANFDDEGHHVVKEPDTITVTGTTHLYPIFKNVYWLSFYSGPTGLGATYYPETYYFDGAGPANLNDRIPVRDPSQALGQYVFDGWYADSTLLESGEVDPANKGTKIANADGTLVASAASGTVSVTAQGLALTGDSQLYAVWANSTTANYSIVIMKQKASDAEGLQDSEKTYEFSESFVIPGTIGADVSAGADYKALNVAESYNRLHTATVTEETNPYKGYTYNAATSTESVTVKADGSSIIYVRYDWATKPDMTDKTFTLTFADSVSTAGEISENLPVAVLDLAYGADLSGHVPSDPESGREGYSFLGWYADRACTTRVFFADNEDYQAYTGTKALYDTMPGVDLTVYAGWKKQWYVVTIDPNYGAMYKYEGGNLVGTGSTWFWLAYGGQIQEYTTVTRDYVESDSGTYYYVNHAGDGGGGTIWPDRYTYYTTDPSEATEFTTFAYEPGVYRYDGWYEVLGDGTEVPYDFSRPVDHYTTIRLHWTKVGAFYLNYVAGAGTLNDGEELEPLYVELDGDSYADNASVVVTRTATAPEDHEFVGWKIRGDSSGKIYYPGQTFNLLTEYAATVQGRKIVYLDAVYTMIPTARIVYHANGGVIEAGNLSYGDPAETGGPVPVKEYNVAEGTATISNLVNNSRFYVSDGTGFSMENASFAGWCSNPQYDPAEESAPLLVPGTAYGVDTAGPVNLYAVWEVEVRYHLNKSIPPASWGGDWTEDGFDSRFETDTYYWKNEYLGTMTYRPGKTPTAPGMVFSNWRTAAHADNTASDGSDIYDFSETVTGPLDLYGYWTDIPSVNLYIVDASAETIELMTMPTGITMPFTIPVGNGKLENPAVPIDEAFARGYYDPGSGYVFAFATNATDIASITENPITGLYYDYEYGAVSVAYDDNSASTLESGENIYFVYYRAKSPVVRYVDMSASGVLTTVASISSSAPTSTPALGTYDDNGTIKLTEYDVAENITSPLDWAGKTGGHYTYAIGKSGSAYSSHLMTITGTSVSDSDRPALRIRNTWRGFEYTLDNGANWDGCGYDPEILTVYYGERTPTLVDISEVTYGTAAEMSEGFEYNYTISNIRLSDNTVTSSASTPAPIVLHSGEEYSVILFTDPSSTQEITVTQTPKAGFACKVNGTETNEYTYRAYGSGKAQKAEFTNSTAARNIEVHLVAVNVADGSLVLHDDWRTGTTSFSLELDESKTLNTVIPGNTLINGHSEYAFGAIFYGTDKGTAAIPADDMTLASVHFKPAGTSGNEYDIYLRDDNGYEMGRLESYKIYYLYYPKLTVHYMKEGDNGGLSEIQGATAGQITYGGEAFSMNGVTVTQNQKVTMPHEGLTISQNVGQNTFSMPPLLDDGTNQYNLVYSKIGAAAQADPNTVITNVSELNRSISEDRSLYMKIVNNKLSWSFDEVSWNEISSWPVVYAIYRERGYDLTVTKTVSVDTGNHDPYTITVSSTAINRTSYEVEGTGSSTISATVASGETPGKIEFTVVDGSSVKLIGLGAGTYTIAETSNDNHTLTAKVGSEVQTVVDNSKVTLVLDGEKTLDLINTPEYICKVGFRRFYSISSAVDWIEANASDFTGTIEMLVDYLIPSSDSPEIPEYLTITLTSAEGGTKTITRKGSFTSGPIFTNWGSFTLQDIIIDGGNVPATGAVIANDSELVIGNGTEIRNAVNSGNGGAVSSTSGSVTVLTESTISGNRADKGGAIYASAGTVSVSGGTISSNSATSGGAVYYTGTDTVTISDGSVDGNSAADGGAVYMNTGTLSITGGTVTGNGAVNKGGAVYGANAAIGISGGTIGGASGGNTAGADGGAVYAEAGSVTVSGNAAISYNSATRNGGAISVDTASATISGGSIDHNEAVVNGGAVYVASGTVTLSGSTMTQNSAVNGAAVFVDTGSGTFSGGSITANSASNGGAVGIGSTAAKLYFSGNIQVKSNTMGGAASNVYLDQDSDAIINATGLGSNAEIGIYVPEKNITVGGDTVDLYDYRGMPGGFFGSYTSDTNVGKFKNDRQSALTVQKQTSSKRLYWGKGFVVQVRYLSSFSASFPTVEDGVIKQVDNNNQITYFAPSGSNAASDIANDLRNNHTIKELSASSAFAFAFVGDGRSFSDYVTDVNWEDDEWKFVKRDGTKATGTKLTIYFAEPTYIMLENNSGRRLTVSGMTVLGQSVINRASTPGYGYVFAVNGVIQDKLEPVTASDLTLPTGNSVKLLIPGGRNASYTLTGSFDGTAADVSYTMTGGSGNPYTLAAADTANFTLPLSGQPNKTLNNSNTFEIVFGGSRAICKIVTTVDAASGFVQKAAGTESGTYEYTFSSLNQAKTFITANSIAGPTIEMLVDYLIPGSDVIVLPKGNSYTFTTATTGVYQYPGSDTSRRATISRDDGNNSSFISTETGDLVSGDYNSSLTVKNLIFDGKAFGGNDIQGGVVKTKGFNVEIENCDFRNGRARYGGGIFIESVWPSKDISTQTPYGHLTVKNSHFTNCQSLEGADKFGGGGIWTSMREMALTDCTFDSCEGAAKIGNSQNAQGGAVFHYVTNIDAGIPTKSTVTDCHFNNCSANAAGSMECGSREVRVTGCTFRNSVAKTKNGGALNVWVYDSASPTKQSSVYVENCTFENCYCLNNTGSTGNGGALRSTATNNTIINCTFTGVRGNDGGAVNISNTNATDTLITDCTFDDCNAGARGGAVFCTSKNLTINGSSTTIQNCTAPSEGGGVYHTGSVSLNVENATIAQNTSGKTGGGIHTTAGNVTVSGSIIRDNTATGNGGGICHSNDKGTLLTLENNCSITGNRSGGMGGGVYTASNLAMSKLTITGNSLTHDTEDNAAGIYVADKKTVTAGKTKPDGYPGDWSDQIIIRDNKTDSGVASDMRLPMTNSVNSNSVSALCDLKGEVRVVNAKVKGTQFGYSPIAYVGGFSDLDHVFISDDGTLYGIVDRADPNHQKLIWGTEPICKITDDRGRLLYLRMDETAYPAVFDYLDRNNSQNSNEVSAFGIIRGHDPASTPKLFNSDGTPYTGTTYQVKMLVENYTEDSAINTPADTGETVVLTTAGSGDSLYPYRGRTGTRATVLRGSHSNAMIAARCNVTLQNIVLDSGSESGAQFGENSRIIIDETEGTTIRLGKNSAIQNARLNNATKAYGAGVRLHNGASLIIEGGTVRNCSTGKGGGGVQVKNGNLTINGGSITRCSAADKGGGIFFENGTFTMTGGSISRCSAPTGAGVWVAAGKSMTMSGGSISGNTATSAGGGIAVESGASRLYFSGAAYVYGNTLNGNPCNVQMNQHFDYGAINEAHASDTTVIVSRGLVRGATIGVYVPDGTNLYNKHGDIQMPFATYEPGTSNTTLNYFINDRNSLKGGLYDTQASNNYMIYWVKIYTLSVSKLVMSDDPADMDKVFQFRVTLEGEASGILSQNFNGVFGDLEFVGGVSNFTLRSGETKSAEKLPNGYSYTVEELLSLEDQLYYKTTPSLIQTGSMNIETKYLYEVKFSNVHAICKITDSVEGLLYYVKNGEYVPAIYSKLTNAFNALRATQYYYYNGSGYATATVNTASTNIEMLVDYPMGSDDAAVFQTGTMATLKTADPAATDGYPYVGSGSTATITRGYDGHSMITVNGDLTLGNITFDGNSSHYAATTNGGVLNVAGDGEVTVGTGTTISNSVTSQHGAGIYLAEGAILNISGSPVFSNNNSAGVSLPSGSKNGDEAYTSARQDIYIEGYSGVDASSLVVTGSITSAPGSIWVWAANARHYEQSKQFAVMSGGQFYGLTAFRNARTDSETKNPLNTNPKYLYGIAKNGKVYWTGSMDLTVIKKVEGDGALETDTFTFTVSGLENGEVCSYTRHTYNGSVWVAATGTGAAGTLNADSSGKVTFTLSHNQKIVISIPTGTSVTVSENSGSYIPSWNVDSGSFTDGSTTGSITMDADRTVEFKNLRNLVSPTGLQYVTIPYLIVFGIGLILVPLVLIGRKKRKAE